MMKNVFFKEALVVGIIVLFLGMSVTPSIGISNNDDITPPVSTHTLDPPVPDGLNDYYVRNVTVTLNATDDISGVKEIKYQLNDGPTETIPGDHGTFIIYTDNNLHTVRYWAIDYAGNQEPDNSFSLRMDQTPPVLTISYEIVGGNWLHGWDLLFGAEAIDACSGMVRVEYFLNAIHQDTFTGPGPYYEFGFKITTFRRVFGLIRNLEITEEYVNFTAMQVIALGPSGSNIHLKICGYDFAGHVSCSEIHFTPAIAPGIYLFKNLSLPNFYSGYIGEFFIFAQFY